MPRARDDVTGSLFPEAGAPSRRRSGADGEPREDAPLADRVRPRTLDEILGQEEVLGPGRPLRRAIEQDQLRSLILWGPPGSGKTTLAFVIRRLTRAHFEAMSAVLSGVKEVREVMRAAEERRR
ncbi:MAG TPA: AAA family ATPase, partial [Vicinamibacteria bacterium]|nr:AAA family ATPase [Vicinamibacteria bacterium]